MKPHTGSLMALLLWSVALPVSFAQNVTTVAGGFVGDGRPATHASFQLPAGLVRDASGNSYVSDETGQRIRKITSGGVISTFAGTGIAGFFGDGGPATAAKVNYPLGMTLDAAGDLIFADAENSRVRKVDLSGNISTIAGNGTPGFCGDSGPALVACLNFPWYEVFDAAGNLYISDYFNNRVRKVDTSGTITTFAGNGTAAFCGDGGNATLACLNGPHGLVFDSSGSLYIADALNHRVRKVTAAGTISTFAGNGVGGFSGDGGQAILAAIGTPKGLAIKSNFLYISGAGQSRVRDVVLTGANHGIINTFIGSSTGYDGDHHAPLSTQLDSPISALPLSASSMLVVDTFNARLRQLSGGLVTTVGGGFIGDGNPATSAAMVLPQGIAFDSAGNLYIAEFYGNRIRKVDTTGKISTVAGTGVSGYTGDGGPATSAELNFPQGVIVDAANNLFITDAFNNVIRKVDTSGTITTFSTSLNYGGGLGFMAFDGAGTLYVGDGGACVVWKVDSSGNPTAVAGVPFSCGYNGDNITATSAFLNAPYGVAIDSRGNLFIADASNERVRKVNPSGIITTIAGNGVACASPTSACGDGGPATAGQLNVPLGIALMGGNLFIADELDLRIRKVAGGNISTYAGSGLLGYNGNGLPALSTNFDDPLDVAVNPVNNAVYMVDDGQDRVRIIH